MRASEMAFMTKVQNVVKDEEAETLQINELCQTIIQNFEVSVKETISQMNEITYRDRATHMLLLELPTILETIIESCLNLTELKLTNILKVRIIKSKGDTIVIDGDKRAHPMTHDLVKDAYESFQTKIWLFKTSPVLLEAIRDRKKELLYGKALETKTVIPGLDFVEIGKDETIGQELYKMTADTFEKIYTKNLQATLERMKAKQYISDNVVSLFSGCESSTDKLLRHKLPFVNTMFRKTYAKILAIAYTTGQPVVEYMGLAPVPSQPIVEYMGLTSAPSQPIACPTHVKVPPAAGGSWARAPPATAGSWSRAPSYKGASYADAARAPTS
jgi:hypothetical protein